MARHIAASAIADMTEIPAIAQDRQSNHWPTKKELGAYYTPSILASLLAEWAIRSPSNRILEPGFGGCGFLQAAVDRLSELGCLTPKNQLYGCDIDPQAFAYLSDKLGILNIERRYILSDFVAVSPGDFSVHAFDVVIGNPPYVSLHNMPNSQKESIKAWRAKEKIKLNGRASLWAYFVLHAMSFLKSGGKMAWVLPGSFLQADYAASIREAITACFEDIIAIQLTERMFLSVGTEERTVVLLCSGFGGTSEKIKVVHCASAERLKNSMASHRFGVSLPQDTLGVQQPSLETIESINIFQELSRRQDTVSLGDLGKVLIGTVTGANRFFIMSPSLAKQRKLGKQYLKPILSKFSHLQGAQVNGNDVEAWCHLDKPCLLLHLADKKLSQAAAAYIATFPEEDRCRNSTFKRRSNWLAADDGRIPDAFLSYMTHDGPRIVLNNAGINATNSIHRICFHQAVEPQTRKLVAISLCTTFSQLSAELEGRSYGSGVLKIEPSEANRIKLVLPRSRSMEEIEITFAQIDLCFRQGDPNEARRIADRFVLGDADTTTYQGIIQSLSTGLETARNQRRRLRNES